MKTETIIKRIENNKELSKRLIEIELTVDSFIDHSKRYIKAIKEGRIICNIANVSSSGMSRNIKFLECSKNGHGYGYYNFYVFFKALGYTSKNDTFRISGCGMDMILHTNYSNIHNLYNLGFINKAQCSSLAQMTPSII